MLEVISDHVFPFLRLNDLLRLRRVCKVSKELVDDYLGVYGTSERLVSIDLRSDEMTAFLALTYPINLTRFDIWNQDNSSWNSEEMQTFLTLYGEKITHLEIYRLTIPIESPSTVQFFEGIPNLIKLTIGHLCGEQVDDPPSPPDSQSESDSDEEQGPQVEEPLPDLNLPSTFKRLTNLHVRFYSCDIPLVWKLLEECSTHLESINHPCLHNPRLSLVPGSAFERIRWIVERRHRENPDTPNLEYLDLVDLESEDGRSFYELVTTCSTHNVKLQHVDAKLIEKMMQLDTPDRGLHEHKISRCVVSIKNLTPSVFRLELPLLEEINIRWTSACSMPEGDFEAQPWSNLKKLRIHKNSDYLNLHDDDEVVSVSRLFEFFFHGIRRENLESLDLSFEWWDNLSYPNMTNVCLSCPNLKKVDIYNWPGINPHIAQLWGNLPLLEDVKFHSCATLGDGAFIGYDVTSPAIWKATRLKSLSLKYLEYMPGITDTLFTVALRHMPLKNLYLESWDRVSSITLAGLESLLTGKFAETIEKFTLKGKVNLEGVTDDQLEELEGKFRSAQM